MRWRQASHLEELRLLSLLGVALVAAWVLDFGVIHLAGGLRHLLLLLAVVVILYRLVERQGGKA